MAKGIFSTVSQRAACAAASILPVTAAGVALIFCGCSRTAWGIEILAAISCIAWIAKGGTR